ncbi:MAG: hypothetical protein ACM4AI_15480, partial [Acidobacteriota bacterium]
MSARLVRLLPLLYPPSLRREHGMEIALTVSEAWRAQRGLRARARLAAHLVADVVSSWPRAWKSGPRRPPPPPPDSRRPVLLGFWGD